VFYLPAFLCTYLGLGADRMAFAVDYPYESAEQAVRFILEAPISEQDKEKICWGTAARLLKL
jgi:2,3-dihydroxybenzoate decarboxylase